MDQNQTAPAIVLPQQNGARRLLRACLRQPVDRAPAWFLRQAGRYMQEYRDVRRHHTLLEICRRPELAAEVTITAAEKLNVDAAIIFADLLLPFTPMGLDFEFVAGEGPVVHTPIRTPQAVDSLRTDRAAELSYVSQAISRVSSHFHDRLGIIGFAGAPFTLASYMIEGGSSRQFIHTKQFMYKYPSAWQKLQDKLVSVVAEFCEQQVEAGADVIQIFDSWVGALGPSDYCDYALAATTELIHRVQGFGVPVIYFGVDTATLLPLLRETGADVIGLDWRIRISEARKVLGPNISVQGNLDPLTLLGPLELVEARVKEVLREAGGQPGHIFNVGHGLVPETPVENVQAVVKMLHDLTSVPHE